MSEPQSEQIGEADVVVGLIKGSHDGPEMAQAIAHIVESVPASRAVLLHPPYAADGAAAVPANNGWKLISDPRLGWDPTAIAQSFGESFRAVFEATLKSGAQVCAVIVSDFSEVTAQRAELLLNPARDQQFDLVAPCYARHPFEGLINRAIVYPLMRALYGKRIRNPLGPDFGISSRLLERISSGSKTRMHPVVSLASEAATGNLKICQSHLGQRSYSRPDWTNLSSVLSQVLAPVFLDVERYAPHWQHARGSTAVQEFGQPMFVAGPENAVEVSRLLELFSLASRNLPEVWSMILPPSTLVELRRLARQENGFQMPDEMWARIVYDFALSFRLRTINRDQMLRALTPIYLGWVASYALELENATPEAIEQRLERLCSAYETTKSYFIARWRWPDRFNP
ncbi:MAG TPA: hypothetical protein VGM43_09050 [Bryobacteraceae bacterium]|jgi:hypothetical protein